MDRRQPREFSFLQFGMPGRIIEAGERYTRGTVEDLRRRLAERVGLTLTSSGA